MNQKIEMSELAKLPTIRRSCQFYELFEAISEYLSFSEFKNLAYQDDSTLKIDTIFEIEGEHDGKNSSSIKRVLFNDEIIMYINYDGKYGDEPTPYIVNLLAYKDFLKYIESVYNDQTIQVILLESDISNIFNSNFTNFVKNELTKLK